MSIRDSIRGKTVGSKSEYRTIEHKFDGETVVFKQPSLRQRKQLIDKSVVGKEVDGVTMQVWAVIMLTYDVDGNQVFDDSDFDALMNKPAGSFVDEFSDKALSLLGNAEKEEEEASPKKK